MQRAPSATHALEHASPVACGRHLPLQHSRETAQLVPSPLHATTCSQRSTFALVGSPVHFSDCAPQHCGSPVHVSPPSPHAAFAQRFTPEPSATHDPEQQSAPVSQRSQIGAQPPIGTQRFAPSDDVRHLREQQSASLAQTSLATREQGLPSPAVHAVDAAQRPLVQVPEQQSSLEPQTSPVARQASSSAQRRLPSLAVAQRPPQQSPSTLHVSPAGAQPGSFAQELP